MIYLFSNYPKIGGPIDISHFLSPLNFQAYLSVGQAGHSTKNI